MERNEHLRIFRGRVGRWAVGDDDDDDDETAAPLVTRIMMNNVKHFGVDIVILTRFMLCDNRIITELQIVSTASWYNSVKFQSFKKVYCLQIGMCVGKHFFYICQ